MSTRSEELRDGERIPQARRQLDTYRIAAVVAWLLGTFTTYLFIARVMPSAWLLAVVLAAAAQWLLTIAERPLWRFLMRRRGGKFVALGLVVTFVDGLINAGGVYPYMGRLAQTDVGVMIAEVLNVQQAMSPLAAFLLAFAIGLTIAGLPEYLWEAGERG
jgi:hypothetical protein